MRRKEEGEGGREGGRLPAMWEEEGGRDDGSGGWCLRHWTA